MNSFSLVKQGEHFLALDEQGNIFLLVKQDEHFSVGEQGFFFVERIGQTGQAFFRWANRVNIFRLDEQGELFSWGEQCEHFSSGKQGEQQFFGWTNKQGEQFFIG